MTYKVLCSMDALEWGTLISTFDQVDIYYTLEYCKIYEENQEGLAQLFVYTEGEQMICYPYLLREIPNKKSELNHIYYDISTPYGYGGPVSNVIDDDERKALFERFSETFSHYCKEKGIVSEFVRFHPLLKNFEDYESVEPTYLRNTVSIDLTEDDIIGNFTTKGRNRYKHAIKHGLTVCQESPENLGSFLDQYYKTMDKNNADDYYYFSKDYFQSTINLLKDDKLSFFVVKYNEKIIANTFFLHYKDHVSYHLTGSDKNYLNFSPYNLLIGHCALWFKEQGYKYLHLGGGYNNNDSLFKFKSNFTKKPPFDFYIGRKVHCPDVYHSLTEDLDLTSSYFPLYRDPSLNLKGENSFIKSN